MITTIIMTSILVAGIIGAAVVARRRRQSIERFAELAGVRRVVGESDDDLLARAAARFRVFTPAVRVSSPALRLVADEPLAGGDVVSIDVASGRVRRARGGSDNGGN